MLTINWKQVYEVDINGSKKWILILYNISKNHYVGLPVYSEEIENSIFIKSINKHAVLSEISDYNRTSIKRCIYLKGKILKITKKEMDKIFLKSKDYFLDYVKNNTNNDSDGIAYNKWCKEKIELINKKDKNITTLKVGAICWGELGYNVGNELRKLRPVVLWRSSANKEMWTVIPLTSKHKGDKYYFHYDLENEKLGTIRIENLINISSKRIKEPYFIKNKIATITKKDNDEILKRIKKYYAFEKIKIESKITNNKQMNEKVLT